MTIPNLGVPSLHAAGAGLGYASRKWRAPLQVLLAMSLPQCGYARACQDMDEWGYSFRLGSTAAWFEADAADARDWLVAAGLITAAGELTGQLRL